MVALKSVKRTERSSDWTSEKLRKKDLGEIPDFGKDRSQAASLA